MVGHWSPIRTLLITKESIHSQEKSTRWHNFMHQPVFLMMINDDII